jgi:hypothetical protein
VANIEKEIRMLTQYMRALDTMINKDIAALWKQTPLYTGSSPTVTTATKATKPVESISNLVPSDFTNHSGGALGSDSAWDSIGKELGFINQNHYYSGEKSQTNAPIGNIEIDEQDFNEGKVEAANAAKRNWGYQFKTMKDVRLVRNWAQVKYSDTIFAIGSIVGIGEPVFPKQANDTRMAITPSVTGGTGYAVAMAINNNKPVYVFNQSKGSYALGWHLWDVKANDFVPTKIPVLTKNYAGIGTREINADGLQAIRDVYKRTFEATMAKPPAPVTPTTPVEEEAETPPTEPRITTAKLITREMVIANPNTLFVFGDNDLGTGTGGQAIDRKSVV